MATRALDTRARRYDPAETRQRVLEAANMLFSTRGFASTGTADIARAADVSEGSIFYHFGSKQNLLTELGRRHGEAMIAAMEQGDALEDLEPGIIIPRVFRFCLDNNIWEAMAGVPKDSPSDGDCAPKTMNNPDVEPFYHAAKDTTTAWITNQMRVSLAKRGITGINIPMAASFTHHIVGDAIDAYMVADDARRAEIEAETVRFVRAACGVPPTGW